jgi:hypothetical protein
VQDGNNVKINASTFTGMGRAAVESDININASNDGWKVKKNVWQNMADSCALLDNNTNLLMGELVSGKPANGNTCSVVGVTGPPDPGIDVNDQGVGGANALYANTVLNSHGDCYEVQGDGAIFKGNNCITSQMGRGVYLNGDGIVADSFSTTLSSGHTDGTCIVSDGDNLKLTNFKCGATRDQGVVINGDGSTVTNGSVRQSVNTCLDSEGDNQVWNNVSCGHVTASGEYGLEGSSSANSTFTKIAIGDTNGPCAFLNTSGEQLTTFTCNSAGSYGIEMNDANLVVNGFTVSSSQDNCVYMTTSYSNGLVKSGKCGSVLNGANGIQDDQFGSTIDGVNVVAAGGDCFNVTDDAVTLKNSTGTNCGTAGSGDGIDWTGAGSSPDGPVITNNSIAQSADYNLYASVTGGDFTVTNNKFHDATSSGSDCVNIATPDNLTMSGNKIQGCQNGGAVLDVDTDPHVTSNTVNDASGLSGNASLSVQCDTSCDLATVNLNSLDGGGNEAPGLLFTNNTGGDQTFNVNNNTITNMSGHGMDFEGDGGGLASGNVVQNSGDADEFYGILLATDDNTLRNSNVSGGHDNGIEVTGNGNALDHNNSHDNDEDGIHFVGDNNASVSDTTKNNAGEGFEDDGATGNTVDGLTSSGNREDCTGQNNGTYGGTTANNCADGSDFSEDGVIDKPVKTIFGSIF